MILALPIKPAALNKAPTLASLIGYRRHINLCTIYIPLRGNLVVHLHVAVPQPLYALETANIYPGMSSRSRRHCHIWTRGWGHHKSKWQQPLWPQIEKSPDENLLDAVLIKQLYDMLGTHALNLMEIAVTIANATLPQVFDKSVDKWGTTTPQERLSNLSSIGAPWHES